MLEVWCILVLICMRQINIKKWFIGIDLHLDYKQILFNNVKYLFLPYYDKWKNKKR